MENPKQNLEHHKELLYKKLAENPFIDKELVLKAIEYGEQVHRGQYRKTGDYYFVHPIRVALSAIEYNLDTYTIISSLLHDSIEDTEGEKEKKRIDNDILSLFGESVSSLVNALTKVRENQNLTLYKIFQLGKIDFRVILVKLLDRLDNLTDLNYLSRAKQRSICRETTAIYAEIAHGLGLIEIEEDLRDRVFKILYPFSYKNTSDRLMTFYKERKQAILKIIKKIEDYTPPGLIVSISPQYSQPQEYLFNRREIVRVLNGIIVETQSTLDCYNVLGCIHTSFRSIPQNINDYISNPKANGWRGLTTKVIINGERITITIVTREFQEKNRKGVLTLINEGLYQSDNYGEFLQLYLEVASDNFRIDDVFRYSKSKTIQTLTPAGDIIELRYGATILDFAFMVHTELGLKTVGGVIEGIRYPRDKILEDGMVIKVLTSDAVFPENSWLNDVVMPKSRKEIFKCLHQRPPKKTNLEKKSNRQD
jgi:GTP pyrophosphokinase/guanosine-3',5'-bis(diphosphate) 3'-pyrophosphohydrolase